MCGIFAIVSKDYISLELVKEILIQLKIRGKHSTGLSWVENEELKVNIQPVPADLFIIPKLKTKVLIGHTRYSTSSLEYNQPIMNEHLSAVHNGVITQQDSKHWDNQEYVFKTKNDSEYILKSFLLNKHPLKDYPNASISTCVIDNKEKKLKFFRNDKRPLWYYKSEECIIATSTKDIFERLQYHNTKKCISCNEYEIPFEKLNVKEKIITESIRDLQ